MVIEQVILSACITIFSAGLLVVSILSYRRYKNTKLLIISGVFIVLFIKGLLMSYFVFDPGSSPVETLLVGSWSGVFDVVVLVLLFYATLKR